MSLRTQILDAVLDGKLGAGLVVTRQEVVSAFPDAKESYCSAILANSEINALHGLAYPRFTMRLSNGAYRILPAALEKRLQERAKHQTS